MYIPSNGAPCVVTVLNGTAFVVGPLTANLLLAIGVLVLGEIRDGMHSTR
ncbi:MULTISPECIES: hypothetical protein [unclassified Methanoculleus]|uniref:Uncharacterized protein n=1 Tax=Methanoculleus palmolei TaxID=72612 RepID=A0ABD8A8P5_9EURY|nr:hypothetical protein [Methanoculleus sp. UBA377]MDD2472891.1 hypothetical protein [Methanoculleus sp.]WOX55899.1 hypothetical protein R6Y95_00840 [Methanoculleus palmolei]